MIDKITGKALYHCKLVYKGFIREQFYRSGDSEAEVLKGLEEEDHGKGAWEVSNTEYEVDDDV